MDFHELRQAGNNEIPLVGQTVTPAARRQLGIEACAHHGDYMLWIGAGVEIEVAAEIRPVIERFDHRDLTSGAFKGSANVFEIVESVVDTRDFLRERILNPLCRSSLSNCFEHSL